MKSISYRMIKSWADDTGHVNSTEDLLKWINEKNSSIKVNINKISLKDCIPWHYDKKLGIIKNADGSFFRISGFKAEKNGELILEQPIILQNEIGYLGIICKEINGVIHFLMQAKIEPGNINKVQISPTIQATKSNFTQKHGGKKPAYLDYFLNADKYQIIADQLQSEQSSRFYKKRNRNIIILIDEDIEILPSHKWMTLGQIKTLMNIDNIVNMDTRTVISCIPFCIGNLCEDEKNEIIKYFSDSCIYESMFGFSTENILPEIYQYLNNYKMFDETETKLVPLHSLSGWRTEDNQIICSSGYSFKVIFCDIEIEGREVVKWKQPLFEADGSAVFGLIMCNADGVLKFLVHAKPESGCFDKIELGPSVQLESNYDFNKSDDIVKLFIKYRDNPNNIIRDVMLSEEGGRFYCEQNHNILMMLDYDLLKNLPKGYFLVDFKTLNGMTQINNILNIQLRNLLSLISL